MSVGLAFTLVACSGSAYVESKHDVVDAAKSEGALSTLVTALEAADLVTTLKGEGPFTIFAPNDAAFSKLPEGTLEYLLKPENKDQLSAILTYHVVPGKLTAKKAEKLISAATLHGKEVAIKSDQGTFMVGTAKVVKDDIRTKNGIIHVIDTVILLD
jgi:uncharacterized surface protein with fasciclin (FAS1) repeats